MAAFETLPSPPSDAPEEADRASWAALEARGKTLVVANAAAAEACRERRLDVSLAEVGPGGAGIDAPDATFDSVVVAEVLHRVPAPDRLIAACARAVRRGGRAIITVPAGALEGEESFRAFLPWSLVEAVRASFGPVSLDVHRGWMRLVAVAAEAGDAAGSVVSAQAALEHWALATQEKLLEARREIAHVRERIAARDESLERRRQRIERLEAERDSLRERLEDVAGSRRRQISHAVAQARRRPWRFLVLPFELLVIATRRPGASR